MIGSQFSDSTEMSNMLCYLMLQEKVAFCAQLTSMLMVLKSLK